MLIRLPLVLLLLAAWGAAAEEETSTDDLRERIESLRAREEASLENDVEDYLRDWEPAGPRSGRADPLDGVSIRGRFTALSQSTLDLDPSNRSVVVGDVDLDFDFRVTDHLELFVYLTANADERDDLYGGPYFPPQFPHVTDSVSADDLLLGATLSGLADGIGVDGTRPVAPGSVAVYESGIRHSFAAGATRVHWSIGLLDPRTRFLQNDIADDENRQFLNNLFDDSPSVLWLSDATGRLYFGIHAWVPFGDNNRISMGWFNEPGQFWNHGQLFLQISWQGEVRGGPMNLRITGFVDEYRRDAEGNGDLGGGVSWDWHLSEMTGLFARFVGNSGDTNPVQWDAQLGVEFVGPFGKRDLDVIALAVGAQQVNDQVVAELGDREKDREFVIELYYRYVAADGKLQITPSAMFVIDPGAGLQPWQDDRLVILGLRIFVPF